MLWRLPPSCDTALQAPTQVAWPWAASAHTRQDVYPGLKVGNGRPHDTADVDRPQRNADRSGRDRVAVLKPYAQNYHVPSASPC